MSPILPILGLGALAAVALASSKSSASEVPQLPDGSAPGPDAEPVQKLQTTRQTDDVVKDPVASQSPGVWQGLSAAQQNRVAGILIALGVDPQTGQMKSGAATQTSIAIATAYAAELARYKLPTASQALRQWAEKAAADIPCKPPEALATLPGELACAISRTIEMEKDPKKIRAFIGRLQPYAHIPQVKLAINTLELEARNIESLQDQADALAKTDAIQKNKPVPEPEPSGMSPQLQNAMAQALERLKNESDKNAPGFATQIGLLLKNNGYPVEGEQVIALAKELKAKQAAGSSTMTPSANTYTVKSGDYPFSIAKRFTGDGSRWRELQAANPQYNFTKSFLAGYVLKLPASWSGSSSSTALATTTPAMPAATSTPAVTVPAERTYTVKRGDYPYGLAQKWTGNGNRWRELQTLNPQYNFTKSFLAGYVLKIPSSWPAKPATIAGDCVGGDCGCVGGDCACVGCGPVIVGGEPGDSFQISTHFEERGGKLYAHGYLHDKKTGPQIFSVAVDMRPIARSIARLHQKLHSQLTVSGVDPDDFELVGCSPDYVGECIQVGRRRFRLRRRKGKRRGLLKKLGRSVKKVARAKAIKKLSRAARDLADPKKYKGIKRVMLGVAAVVYPPVGAPALAAYETGLRVSQAIEKRKKQGKKAHRIAKKVSKKLGSFSKLKRYAKKTFNKVRSQLAGRARRKGLIAKLGKVKIKRAINRLAKKVTSRKLSSILKRAPSLRKNLAKRRKLLRQFKNVKKLVANTKSAQVVSKIREMANRAKRGDVKAQKASQIMTSILESQHRINQRTTRKLPAGSTGILIDSQGRAIHGRYVREPSGQTVSTLLTKSGKMPGYYRRVAG